MSLREIQMRKASVKDEYLIYKYYNSIHGTVYITVWFILKYRSNEERVSLSLDDDLVDESELLARAHDRVCNRMCGRADSSVERPLTPVPPRSPTRERTATRPAYSPINSVMRRANFHLNWVHKLERCHSLFCSMKECHADALFATVTTPTTMCGIGESLSVQLAKKKLERR